VERGAAAASSEQVVEEHSAEQEVEEHSAGPAEDCGHDDVPDDEVAHGLPSLGVHDGAFGPRANQVPSRQVADNVNVRAAVLLRSSTFATRDAYFRAFT